MIAQVTFIFMLSLFSLVLKKMVSQFSVFILAEVSSIQELIGHSLCETKKQCAAMVGYYSLDHGRSIWYEVEWNRNIMAQLSTVPFFTAGGAGAREVCQTARAASCWLDSWGITPFSFIAKTIKFFKKSLVGSVADPDP